MRSGIYFQARHEPTKFSVITHERGDPVWWGFFLFHRRKFLLFLFHMLEEIFIGVPPSASCLWA